MWLTKKTRVSRVVLFLVLLVLTQACAAAGVGKPTTAGPSNGSRQHKPRVTELSGCSGERFRIDLLDAIGTMPDDTLDAQREQLRDWIWTVTLGRIAQRTSADEVLTGIVDQPLVRDDALAHVLHMQAGPTRSTTTKSGGAIVMVEAADAQTMTAELAEAIDNEALHIGSTPADAQVYQYVFHPEVARAEVCAMKPVARAEIESTAQRYRSATITTAAQLEGYLSGGVDLLSAQCTEAGLQVTGRQRPRTGRTPITVEQIAALAQARGTRYIPLERFGFSLDRVSNRSQLAENARQIDAIKGPVERQPPDIQILLAWKRQNPGVSMQELMMSLQLQKKTFGRPGFSLDPETNASYALGLLDDMIDALPDVEKLAPILRGLDEKEQANRLLHMASSTNEPFAADAKAALIEARSKLKKAKSEETEAILHPNLPKSLGNSVAQGLMQVVWKKSSYQCARYDGPLHGTATGMTFFYTDLISKIWEIDLNGAAPERLIEGFQSAIHAASSTASCDEMAGKSTRTWFGVREESFTREASGAVHFAPIATRIFSKSSNRGAGNEEFEATAESKRFVQWWDNHFSQVAEWEPQYEVLNQLMKWSVVVQNSIITDQQSCLALLDQVKVHSNHQIATWITETNGLQWRGPVKLVPPPEGSKEKPGDHECLPLFESTRFFSCGFSGTLVGGVGAASLQMVKAKPMRATSTPAHLGRLGAEGVLVSAGEGRARFDKLRGSGGELKNVSVESRPAKVAFAAEIDTNPSQVGVGSSWDKSAPVKTVDKSVEIQGKGIVASERRNGLVSAELKTSDLTEADVKVETKPSTSLEAKIHAQKIAKRMQVDGVGLRDAALELASTHKVMQLADGSIVVKVDSGGSKPKWVHMESGGGNRGPPPSGAEAVFSVGAPDGGSHRPGSSNASRGPVVRVSILDDATAAPLISQRKGTPLQTNAPTLAAVKDKIGNNDFDGAMKALDQNPSPGARKQLLEHALGTGHDANIGRVVDHAIRKGASPSELRAQGERLQREAVLRARSGGDRSALDQQRMKLAIAERRLQTPGRAEAQLEGAAKGNAAIYAHASYSIAAALPPAVHRPGKVLLPGDRYVTRVIETSTQKMPPELEVGGAKYRKRGPPGGGVPPGNDASPDYGALGSSFRLLLGGGLLIFVVMECSDQDPAFPSCH